MIRLKSCKRDGQRLAITLVDGDREESVWLGPQSVGSAFIQQESNAQELAKVIVDAVNALAFVPRPVSAAILQDGVSPTDPDVMAGIAMRRAPPAAETEPVVVPAKTTKRSGK